jgi:hypothetical protein
VACRTITQRLVRPDDGLVGLPSHGRDVNASNTGHTAAPDYPGSLTALSGPFTTSNITYSFRDVGQTTVGQDGGATPTNVEFYGCRFRVTAAEEAMLRGYGTNLRFRYCTFMPAAVSSPPVSFAQSYQYALILDGGYNTAVGQLLVERCNIWGFHDAFPIAGYPGNPLRSFKYNYFHDSADTGGTAHVDFIGHLSPNGSFGNVEIIGNSMVGQANSSILGFQYGNYSNFKIEDNLLGGGGYTVNLQGSGTGNSFQGNDLTTAVRPVFGPLQGGMPWAGSNVWRNNRWRYGGAWGSPANDGKFWIPDTSDASGLGWSDDSFVSATDWAA